MAKELSIKLSNGIELFINLEHNDSFIAGVIEKYLKPIYLQNNDWNATIRDTINEMERISMIYNIKRGDLISKLLSMIEGRLARDISDLTGVDKIEIIFEGIQDYVDDILEAVQASKTQEEARINVSSLVESLNLFETSELLIYFAKKINPPK
jgi:hypothetical protein